MSQVVEEMMAILELGDYNELTHYGMPRRSGRYPWGSGEDPYQHGTDFLARVDELRKQNFTYTDENGKKWTGDTAIAKSMGLSSSNFRTEVGLARAERRNYLSEKIRALQDDGLGPTAIGKELGLSESTVRSMMNEKTQSRMREAQNMANFIKQQVDEKGMIDVGTGIERELRISKERLNQALYILEREGYPIYKGGIPQPSNPGQQTNQRVICPPGTPHKDIYKYDQIHTLNEYISRDGGATFEKKFTYPTSMDSKRLMIRYAEEGGIDKDGVIELRRNVPDLSLGENRYSQVRILVDNDRYLKGMAVYSDNMPDGIDVIFNTNKKQGTDMRDVLKKIKEDPDNPFGSAIKDAKLGGQYWYNDPKTGEKKLGLINKRAAEGDWEEWKNAVPSQFLAKQSRPMAKKQLDLAKADKLAEFDEICSINNPTIRKHFLKKFSDECDSAAVHLQAASLPGQKYHVILPVNSLKDTEVFAPNYPDGSKIALIRYPHGGTFEIPILTVNNRNAEASKMIGKQSIDAVGITAKVAERLSGADFDGDTVMCIPTHDSNGRVKITSTKPLEDLEGFDPKIEYGPETYKGREVKLMKNTQTEMGVISNLINDMTLAGADEKELARAVKHSMVVIDAEKHKLDYKKSEVDNNIKALKKKYQPKYDEDGNLIGYGGAATILSRAKGEKTVIKRQGTPKYNIKGTDWYDPSRPEGALIYKTSDKAEYQVTKTNKRTGEVTTVTKYQHQKSTKMGEVDDAYELVSKARHPMELLYADYANSMKALANKARMEEYYTGNLHVSKTAKETYKEEVSSLNAKLNTALLNSPKERTALRLANAEVEDKVEAAKKSGTPYTNAEIKKLGTQALTKYRQEVGASTRKERNIKITDKEWEAIQAGAISEHKLKQILDNADVDDLRKRATPRSELTLSTAKVNKAKMMANSNYTLEQIADALGVSTSTVSKYLKGVK